MGMWIHMPPGSWKCMRISYTMHEIKLAAIVFVLKIWWYYYKRFKIYSDYKSSKYLFTQTKLNMCQRRWTYLLKDYDCEIKNHLRSTNLTANALSWKIRLTALQVSTVFIMMQECCAIGFYFRHKKKIEGIMVATICNWTNNVHSIRDCQSRRFKS